MSLGSYFHPSSLVLFVVQENERNIFDQLGVERILKSDYNISCIRATLSDIYKYATISGKNSTLFYKDFEIAIVYFRAGYTPSDYPTDNEWSARALLEQSFAIKCPNIPMHLAGTKKIQQVLSSPSTLSLFLPPDHASKIQSCFVGLYPLDDSDQGRKAYEMVMKNPVSFVLKPQREGGGNNIYGADIPAFLSKLSIEERQAYILMDMITPPTNENILVINGKQVQSKVVSEFGVYGIHVSDGFVVHLNESCGHLLRTKAEGVLEGGVASGFSVMDSPLLE